MRIFEWPEHGCASVDIFSCSSKMKPEAIESFLKDIFKAQEAVCREIERGNIADAQLIKRRTPT